MLLITSGDSTTLDFSLNILLDDANCNASAVVNSDTSEFLAWHNWHRLRKLERNFASIKVVPTFHGHFPGEHYYKIS